MALILAQRTGRELIDSNISIDPIDSIGYCALEYLARRCLFWFCSRPIQPKLYEAVGVLKKDTYYYTMDKQQSNHSDHSDQSNQSNQSDQSNHSNQFKHYL